MANKIEDICVSLETAKRLQEAGIVIDTIYEWEEQYLLDELIYTKLYKKHETIDQYGYHYRHYPAPTAEEIRLPPFVMFGNKRYYMAINNVDGNWWLNYEYGMSRCRINSDELKIIDQHKLCEVMASVAIWLKQNVGKVGGDLIDR